MQEQDTIQKQQNSSQDYLFQKIQTIKKDKIDKLKYHQQNAINTIISNITTKKNIQQSQLEKEEFQFGSNLYPPNATKKFIHKYKIPEFSQTTGKNNDISNKQFQLNQDKHIMNKQQVNAFLQQYAINKPQIIQNTKNIKDIQEDLKISEITKIPSINKELLKKQHLLKLNNFDIYFPYQTYPVQEEYMNKILIALQAKQNALLQSPTGTGKTLCLLCSVLSWVQKQKLNKKQRIKIIYLSRTHSQIQQTQNQLKKTCFRPTMGIFGSRDQLCIKQQFTQLTGRNKVQACSKAIKLNILQQKRNKQSQDPKISLEMDQDHSIIEDSIREVNIENIKQSEKIKQMSCSYHSSENRYSKIGTVNLNNRILNTQEMKAYGQDYHFCPYYYPYYLKQIGDLFFMPYNYILDHSLIHKYTDIMKDSIIIFDQAHNVSQAACTGRSYELNSRTMQSAHLDLIRLLNPSYRASSNLRYIKQHYKSVIQKIQSILDEINANILKFCYQNSYNSKGYNKNNYNADEIQSKIIEHSQIYLYLYKMFGGQLTYQIKQALSKPGSARNEVINTIITKLNIYVGNSCKLIQLLRQTFDGLIYNIEKISIFLQQIVNLLTQLPEKYEWFDLNINHYRLFVRYSTVDTKFYEIQIVCMNPSLTFNDIIKFRPRNIIMTSGTMAPLDAWQKQLKIDFHQQLSGNHVIKSQQLSMNIVKSSIHGQIFDFSYKNTNKNRQIYVELAQTLKLMVTYIPNGIMVIFPSYRLLHDFQYVLNSKGYYKSINQIKDILFQGKNNHQIVPQFRKKAIKRKGAIIFCVCRGKITQGIDFSDQFCRSVIFIGVPYSNINDPFIIEKKKYLNKVYQMNNGKKDKLITGEQWYFQNTVRAVNQGLGRVVRHISDYGMIFLMDIRYTSKNFMNSFPKWTRESTQIINQFSLNEAQKIDHFFKKMTSKFGEGNQTFFQNPKNQEQQKKKTKSDAFELIMKQKKTINKKNIDFI